MRHVLLLILGLAVCVTLATVLNPRLERKVYAGSGSAGLMALLSSDSRQILATHFYVKADAYFHSGTYPSIFEQGLTNESHMTGHAHEDHDEDEHLESAEKPARDWIESFGRRFTLTKHTHLENGEEREILPWLKISADLDPQQVTVYLTAAYWLSTSLHRPDEAQEFLRQGLRANPDSYEILLELGRLEKEKDPVHARKLWELAQGKWEKQKEQGLKPDELVYMEILGQLATSEEQSGHYERSIFWFNKLKPFSPTPESIDKHIDRVRAKRTNAPPAKP